jgi:DNA-binding CsgD family transcriptional regulator
MESRYNFHTTFAMIRQCYECDLIIEAYNKQLISEPEKLYFQIRDNFEKFIINFLEEMKTEISSALPSHQHLDFFQNRTFRKKIITRQLNNKRPLLTARELECLHLIAQGMGTKIVANKLNLSVETVNSHTKSIRRKLSCINIAQAVAIAFKHGLFEHINYPNLGI